MNPRRINTHINVVRKQKTRDAAGQHIENWSPLHRKLPAQRLDTGGGSTVRGLTVESQTVAVFRLRHSDILPTDQIHDGADEFNIVKILTRDGEGDWRWVECSKAV
jgi:head-tail adaptor